MGECCERFGTFIGTIFFIISMTLVIFAVSSNHWVEASISNDRGLPTGVSHVNAGLFFGRREIDWGLGSTVTDLAVLDEVQRGVGFYGRLPWIFSLFFIATALFWMLIAIVTSIVSGFLNDEDSCSGPMGTYVWSLLSLICLGSSALLFGLQYQFLMTKNMLLPDQIRGGFSTEGEAYLGYSFYAFLGAMLALLCPSLVTYLSRPPKQEINYEKEESFDPTALLY